MSRRRKPSLPPIPRAASDDHSIAPVAARRALWSRVAGADPLHVSGAPVPLASARGKIENLVGYAQVPLGLAGPLVLDTSLGRRELYVPMATTEGALVASYSRGMKLLAAGGGARARAAELVSADLEQRTKALERFVHGQDVEKRANARAQIEGRGRSVVADATIPRAALRDLARTTPEKLCAILDSYRVGFAELGTHNWLVQAANGLAAVFLACGQDLAYVGECATGQLDFAVDPRGDLYASVHLPALLVGTVGGGSGQGTAAECLRLMGCLGEGQADCFAEILGATVLAGDLSLMAAFTSHEFVAAHERLGRNRPAGVPKGRKRARRKLRH